MKEIVVHMVNIINGELFNNKNGVEGEKEIVINTMREYMKHGVTKYDIMDCINDIDYKYHTTYVEVYNLTLE